MDGSLSPALLEARERFLAATAAHEETRTERLPRVFPPVKRGLWQWKGAVAGALEDIADTLLPNERRRLRRRATALRLCGRYMRVRVCEACEEPRSGSGVTCATERAFPCQARLCPFCERSRSSALAEELLVQVGQVEQQAKERAKRLGDELEAEIAKHQAKADAEEIAEHARKRQLEAVRKRKRKLSELRAVEKYAWRFITLTVAYDPYNPEEMTVEALRERALGLHRAMQHLWDEGLNRGGLGCNALFTKIEMSTNGFVHLHAMYYGGFIPQKWFEETAREAYEDCGFSWLESVEEGDAQGCVREVAKYVTKSAGPMCEDWLAGEDRWAIHPVLAARWEVAMLGMDVCRRYGLLRGLPEIEEEDESDESAEIPEGEDKRPHDGSEHPEDDAKAKCDCCGAVGRWRSDVVKTRTFVLRCHKRREAALFGSQWAPEEDVPPEGMEGVQ